MLKADWYDPQLNPKLESFARHYGFAILPTKPYPPRHKGKVEQGCIGKRVVPLPGRSWPW
ncbi:MAG: hypothetical protein AAF488_01670 [Planctomycetota bacterium]